MIFQIVKVILKQDSYIFESSCDIIIFSQSSLFESLKNYFL